MNNQLPFFFLECSPDIILLTLISRLGLRVYGIYAFIRGRMYMARSSSYPIDKIKTELELIDPGSFSLLETMISSGLYVSDGQTIKCPAAENELSKIGLKRSQNRERVAEFRKKEKPEAIALKDHDEKEWTDYAIQFVAAWEELDNQPYGIDEEFKKINDANPVDIYEAARLWVDVLKVETWVKSNKFKDPIQWLKNKMYVFNNRELITKQLNISGRLAKVSLSGATQPRISEVLT
jgi:hypothetical protein